METVWRVQGDCLASVPQFPMQQPPTSEEMRRRAWTRSFPPGGAQ